LLLFKLFMKLYVNHYEDYLSDVDTISLHPQLTKLYKKFPSNIENLENLIFYGPNGVGKYSQMLSCIRNYSPSKLKYEKKISVTYNKNIYYFKISDIHYEIDMSLLGCNAKMLWNEVYNQINDIILTTKQKKGIIVCKNFHEINGELLESFYSYMQNFHNDYIQIKFILITDEISFIPNNILNRCHIINTPRSSNKQYEKCIKETVTNEIPIKNIHHTSNISLQYKDVCDNIINIIINKDDIKFMNVRNYIYEIFIYNLNINDCIWYILDFLIKNKYIKYNDVSTVLINSYCFLQYFNNNYRPIYHLESFIFYLISIIYGYK